MMKKYLLLVILILLPIVYCKKSPKKMFHKNARWIMAEGGLNLRSKPDLNSTKVKQSLILNKLHLLMSRKN